MDIAAAMAYVTSGGRSVPFSSENAGDFESKWRSPQSSWRAETLMIILRPVSQRSMNFSSQMSAEHFDAVKIKLKLVQEKVTHCYIRL